MHAQGVYFRHSSAHPMPWPPLSSSGGEGTYEGTHKCNHVEGLDVHMPTPAAFKTPEYSCHLYLTKAYPGARSRLKFNQAMPWSQRWCKTGVLVAG